MSLRLSLTGRQRRLTRPAQNARHGWTERDACLVTLTGDSGRQGRGEASPLPGFSPDRLDDCAAALGSLELRGVPESLAVGQSALAELGRASARLPAELPAARAALECALLDLWSQNAERPAWSLLSDARVPAPRRVAALLMGDPEQALPQAQLAYARGVRCFKFKIGRPGAIERELSAVVALRRALGPDVQLRLDANQSLSVTQARAHLPRFAEQDLEYIEEPCAPRALCELRDLALPLACDESLLLGELPAFPVRALILKPSLLGGLSVCAAWAERALGVGAELVVSHAFEGPRGLALSAVIALCWGSERFAHGLDLDGARLNPSAIPYFSNAQLEPWSAPGLGTSELE